MSGDLLIISFCLFQFCVFYLIRVLFQEIMAEPLRVCPSIALNWVDNDSAVQSTQTQNHDSYSLSVKDLFRYISDSFPNFVSSCCVKYYDDEGDAIDLSISDNVKFRFDESFNHVSVYIFSSKRSEENFKPPLKTADRGRKFGGRFPAVSKDAVERATKVALEAHQLSLFMPRGLLMVIRLVATTAIGHLQSSNSDESSTAVHPSITCDGCDEFSISTTRYKCLECANMDFCAQCYKKNKHSKHVMLGIPLSFVREQKDLYLSVINHIIDQAKSAIPVTVD